MIKRDPLVCVVGSNGNMGRRYLSVLRHLAIESCGVDEHDSLSEVDATHFIVATPTDSHIDVLKEIISTRPEPVSVLCEKPFVKTDSVDTQKILAAMTIFSEYEQHGSNLYMVNNYAYYPQLTHTKGLTVYDYYHSGGDGLEWDCIQLIHLAKGKMLLSNSSPAWTVYINGTLLSKDHIDQSYISMVDDFVHENQGKLWGYGDTVLAHLKVINYKIDKTSCL
jgi:hypothetical protein